MSGDPEVPDVDVVILGNDIGVYAMARAFHERYGLTSTAITKVAAGPVQGSRILRTIEVGVDPDRSATLRALADCGERSVAAGRTPLLLANSDTYAWLTAEHVDHLTQWYRMPRVTTELLSHICDKVAFGDLCRELDIPTPASCVYDFAESPKDQERSALALTFPVVAKPAISARFEGLSFPGQRKIYKLDTPAELLAEMARIRAAGFTDRFLLQQLVPGDDTHLRSVTAYVDSAGTVTMTATARVLLQDHTPLALGNPTAMVTRYDAELAQQAARLLRHVGYRGFANFDAKYDARDGVTKFFEVNPRIGRNNYYVTAAGGNIARYVVEDLVHGRRLDPERAEKTIAYSVLPRRLVRRYVSGEDRALFDRAVAASGLFHPLRYRESLRHRRYTALALVNQVLKYRQHYPEPTPTGF